MHIHYLRLKNFKCFRDRDFRFRPGFNLIVGANATGKTTLLDGLAVASGSWLLGLSQFSPYCRARSIHPDEVRLQAIEGKRDRRIRYERHFPVMVGAEGTLPGTGQIYWERTLDGANGRTTGRGAYDIKKIGQYLGKVISIGAEPTLPLISYYGTGRVWQQPRDLKARREKSVGKAALSVFRGYQNSHDPRASAADLFRWIQTQQFIALEDDRTPVELEVVKKAVLNCIEGGERIYFSVKMADLIVEIKGHGRQPYNNLSDGYRNMIAMVGDIAFKAVTLNPHLGAKAAIETPGVVLIDELDLHLHPRWQRRVIDNLRASFPKIQFICTTHSPFLIQSARAGEVISLDGEIGPEDHVGAGLEEVVETVQGVENPRQSLAAKELGDATERYLELLRKNGRTDKAALAQAEKAFREAQSQYTAEPGLNALLKLEALAAVESTKKRK